MSEKRVKQLRKELGDVLLYKKALKDKRKRMPKYSTKPIKSKRKPKESIADFQERRAITNKKKRERKVFDAQSRINSG